MALTRITKGVIKPNENYDTHNINSTGIVTAVGGNFSGNVSVGGTLTYEDVTSIDSVGIITAQKDIHVGAGVSAVGVGTFGGIKIGSATLGNNGTNLTISGGLGIDETIFHNGDTDTGIDFNTNDRIRFRTGNVERVAFESGASSFNGSVNVTQDLDVDGHTNLDNVSVSGVTTFSDTVNVGTGVTIETNGNSNFVGVSSLGTGDTGAVYLYNPDADALSGTTNDIYGWKAKTYTSGLQVNSALYLSRSGSNGLSLSYNNATGSYITANSGFLRMGVPYGGYFNIYSNQIYLKDRLQTTTFALFEKVSNTLWKSSLYSQNQVKLSIEPSGVNVVGTTTSTQLAVTGVSTFSGDIIMQGASGRNFQWDNSEYSLYLTDNGSNSARLKIGSGADLQLYHDVSGNVNHIVAATNGQIKFSANQFSFYDYSGVTERLRIDSNGNIGVNCTPSSSGGAGTLYGTVDHFIAIGDSDTGIAQDGDGQLELWTNNTEIASFNTGQVTLKKVTQINNSIGVGILPQTSGSGSQFGARTYKICIGDNDTGIAQNGDGNLCFYSNNEEIIRIDSGISGTVKNNFIQKEFQRHDTSSQHGPLSTSFTTDGNISATISNYQRGQRIIIRATVPCGIALQSSGTNYAGTEARIKLSNGSSSTYSNDRPVWYRADGSGIHETTQNLFICLYLTESNTTFNNGDTLTVTLEGKKNSGTGTSIHYLGGWSSVKEITVERYEKEL